MPEPRSQIPIQIMIDIELGNNCPKVLSVSTNFTERTVSNAFSQLNRNLGLIAMNIKFFFYKLIKAALNLKNTRV